MRKTLYPLLLTAVTPGIGSTFYSWMVGGRPSKPRLPMRSLPSVDSGLRVCLMSCRARWPSSCAVYYLWKLCLGFLLLQRWLLPASSMWSLGRSSSHHGSSLRRAFGRRVFKAVVGARSSALSWHLSTPGSCSWRRSCLRKAAAWMAILSVYLLAYSSRSPQTTDVP